MTTLTLCLTSSPLPRSEILALAEQATGRRREALLACPEAQLDDREATNLRRAIARRESGEPLAYIVGFRDFHGRRFVVDGSVLIPRHETELLVDCALAWLGERKAVGVTDVLELGTGSGAVAITLALECPHAHIVATDRSPGALATARRNGIALGARVDWVESDWYAFVGRSRPPARTFDLIVSNPPYIAKHDPHLASGDLRFEPSEALTDGADGLQALRTIVSGAAGCLHARGCLMVEHGYDQATAVRSLFDAAGYARIESHRDLAGIERVTVGQRGD